MARPQITVAGAQSLLEAGGGTFERLGTGFYRATIGSSVYEGPTVDQVVIKVMENHLVSVPVDWLEGRIVVIPEHLKESFQQVCSGLGQSPDERLRWLLERDLQEWQAKSEVNK
jgi:hypothetical protein